VTRTSVYISFAEIATDNGYFHHHFFFFFFDAFTVFQMMLREYTIRYRFTEYIFFTGLGQRASFNTDVFHVTNTIPSPTDWSMSKAQYACLQRPFTFSRHHVFNNGYHTFISSPPCRPCGTPAHHRGSG